MLEINVNVTSPDIVQAIGLLVAAIQGEAAPAATSAAPQPIPAINWLKEPQTAAPVAAPATPTAPSPEPTVPASTPAPVTQAPVAAAPTYTVAQVAKAGADLMMGNPSLQPALVELIHKYGAQTVQEIPQDKLGAFATELRQMGAKI